MASGPTSGARTMRIIAISTVTAAALSIGLASAFAGPTATPAAQPAVGLGTATSFAVLAGTTVTNTGPSIVSGDLGVSPGTAITGFPPGIVINGTEHAADAVALQAQNDLTTAYKRRRRAHPGNPGIQRSRRADAHRRRVPVSGRARPDRHGDPRRAE